MEDTVNIRELVQTWSDEERAEAINVVLRFPLGQKSFYAWCATTVTCPHEYCILNPEKTRILLFTREDSDPFFGGQWHVSGSLRLPDETGFDTWQRAIVKYGLNTMILTLPIPIGAHDTLKGAQLESKCPRGNERNLVHVSYATSGSKSKGKGEWFFLNNLPLVGRNALLGHHQAYIREVLMPWIQRT